MGPCKLLFNSQPEKPIMRGKITLITGPPQSGKSLELFRHVQLYSAQSNVCVIIKHISEKDNDISQLLESLGIWAEVLFCEDLEYMKDIVWKKVQSSQVICIDKGELFSDLPSFCDKMAYKGKNIVVAGLQSTARRDFYKPIAELFPLCEEIIKLHTLCQDCTGKASFHITFKMGDKIKTKNLCRTCHPC